MEQFKPNQAKVTILDAMIKRVIHEIDMLQDEYQEAKKTCDKSEIAKKREKLESIYSNSQRVFCGMLRARLFFVN